jgi:hypothetical protein
MMSVYSSGVVGRRTCAALAACSAGLHAVMLDNAANVVVGGLLAVMIVACLYCARDLWLHGTMREWVVVALMSLAMVALHLPAPAHHHGASANRVAQPSTVMALATLVALVEVLAAAAVLYFRTRGRMVEVSGTRDR